jgi:hypothetical protein
VLYQKLVYSDLTESEIYLRSKLEIQLGFGLDWAGVGIIFKSFLMNQVQTNKKKILSKV